MTTKVDARQSVTKDVVQMPEWIVKYWLEWIFGILIAALGILWRHLAGKVKREQQKNEAVEKGVQALLRAQMVNDYNHYSEKGFAPIYARENFENCYTQYKGLGGNGVMKDIHDKFFALPTDKPRTEDQHHD